MKKTEKSILLEKRINHLKLKLDCLLHLEPVNSLKVLKLSQRLDLLITGYYRLKA